MVNIFKFFYNNLNILISSKLIFTKPPKKKILIFDEVGSELILRNLNKDIAHIFYSRLNKGIKTSLNIYIILKLIFKFNLSKINYLKLYLKYVNPKLIITLIDNNETFYHLKKYTKCKTMFIQGAMRHSLNDIFSENKKPKEKNLSVDYMLVFNDVTGKKYKSFLKGNVVQIGSFRSNTNLKRSTKKKIDLIYISTFRDFKDSDIFSPINNTLWSDYRKNEVKLFKIIYDYLKKEKIKLTILGSKRQHSEKEHNYFKNYFDPKYLKFIPQEKKRPTYSMIDNSKLVITCDSTLGYEALSRGNKTAFFSIRGENYPLNARKFGSFVKMKKKGPYWTNSATKEEFYRVINYLKNVKQKEFSKKISFFRSNLCHYDSGNKKFKSIIKKIK